MISAGWHPITKRYCLSGNSTPR